MRDIEGIASSPSPMGDLCSYPNRWKSPVPYLLAGVSLMLLLITVALGMLACSHVRYHCIRRRSSSSSKADLGESCAEGGSQSGSGRNKIINVIMAGDQNPTFIAKPASLETIKDVESLKV